MVAHPVFLYLGYVGLAVPFAFAMGALLSGRTDERWIVATRRWTIVAWTALGIGQLLGAHWAYEEVGWGGYYAWDPVENAALIPWLAATAFLHSVMIQEKRGMLRVWNVTLVSLAFCLSLFGTFLTRSGVVSSIHSFTQSAIGPWFLGFIVVAVAFSTAMIWLRLPQLRTTAKLESLVSREAAFLYNNLLLVALCLTILWGTAWPIVSEAVRGESVVVGRPYFDFFLRIFGLPLLLLMGIGPLVAWRRASLAGLARAVAWPAGIAVGDGASCSSPSGPGSSIPGLIAYTFSAFVLSAIVRRVRARDGRPARPHRRADSDGLRAASWGETGVATAATSSTRRSCCSRSAWRARAPTTPSSRAGSRAASRSRSGATRSPTGSSPSATAPNATEIRAVLDVRRGGDDLGTIAAGKNAYSVEQQVSNEVGIRSDLLTGEDLFVIAEQVRDDGAVVFRVFVKPLVNLIWLAGIVFVLGSLIALWPDAREERRLATRYARADERSETARRHVSGWFVLAAALAAGTVVVVALPFLRDPAPASDALHELDARERALLEAEEERDRALAALKELEADHRAGRLSDEDYRSVVGPLRREAAQALRTLDRLEAGTAGVEAKSG